MRSVLAALILTAMPATVSAECACTCNDGRPVPVCALPTDTPPICQTICPHLLNQSIATRPIDGTTVGGGFVSGSAAGGSQARASAGAFGAPGTAASSLDSVARAFGGGGASSAVSSAGTSAYPPSAAPLGGLPNPTAPALGGLPNLSGGSSLGGLPAVGR